MQPTYIPALRFRALTPWYDFIIQATIRERAFKSRLIQEASLKPEDRILDLGCGTGTLTLLLKSQCPSAHVDAIDADPQILGIARDKAARAGLDIAFHQVMSEALPFPDASFDHVFSSLLVHHLTRDQKLGTLAEVLRILRPGGRLHIADFGRPHRHYVRHHPPPANPETQIDINTIVILSEAIPNYHGHSERSEEPAFFR